MSRDPEAGVQPAATQRFRRAAIAGAAAAMLLLLLVVLEDAGKEDAASGPETSPAAVPSGAEKEPAAAPEPRIRSISIPPLQQEAAAPPDVADAAPAHPAAEAPQTAEAQQTEPAPAQPSAAESTAAAEIAPSAPGSSAAPAAPAEDRKQPPPNGYYIQLGVFGTPGNAESLRQELVAGGTSAYIESRVVVGPYPDRKAAQAAQAKLRREGRPAGLLLPPRKP